MVTLSSICVLFVWLYLGPSHPQLPYAVTVVYISLVTPSLLSVSPLLVLPAAL